ncbi:MAG: UDP-N-acetylmuramoyl-L-alanine--D-glutamate ligase [Burkholderiaceae bacterium]|nr:UDP-N-acetylmuramoyl-L-alanine--D-glutamate ligase [Burkholderiaceae bacterium]
MNFSGQHFLVLGLGESGLAMTQWLLRCGARVRVADTRAQPERLMALQEKFPNVPFFGGEFQANLLDSIDVVAVSPGLSPLRELSLILLEAEQRKIPIWGELELFSLALQELKNEKNYLPKVIAITGTNGKTTVTSLVGQLCQRAGLSVKVAGNISPAMLDVLRVAIDEDDLPQVWVLELSSFQLHSSFSLRADAATVLNLTQDHLDWHGNFSAYCADKARIFSMDTQYILNRQDPLVMSMKPSGIREAQVNTFGADAPSQAGDFGLIKENGITWLTAAQSDDEEVATTKRRKNAAVNIAAQISISRLMPVDALKIRGQHNATNALAALALCRAIGLPLAPLLHGLRDYQGEPHRVELIASVAGVDYIDDSKGTNVGATVAALKGLGELASGGSKKIILIVGGEGKGQDFSPLAQPVEAFVKHVLLIGKSAQEIHTVLNGLDVKLSHCESLQQAVLSAAEMSNEGDTVLMSPACASFDMFRNYEHRAQVFADAVREVQLECGEIS